MIFLKLIDLHKIMKIMNKHDKDVPWINIIDIYLKCIWLK